MRRLMLLVMAAVLAAGTMLAQQPQPAPQPGQAPQPPAARKGRMGMGRAGGMGMGMAKTVVYPPEFAPNLPFSPGVRVGPALFAAGETGHDLKTRKLPATFEGEVRGALDNLGLVLKAAGMDYSDVVNVTVYLTDLDKFGEMNKVYTEYFKSDRPARATVGVANLLGGAHIEIALIAHK